MNTLKQEPVLTGGAAGGAVSAVIIGLLPALWDVLASYGLEITPELQRFAAALLGICIPIIAAYVARRFVTPTANPRNNEGQPLVTYRELAE